MGMDLIKIKMEEGAFPFKVKGSSSNFPQSTFVDFSFEEADKSIICIGNDIIEKTPEFLELEKALAESTGYNSAEDFAAEVELIKKYDVAIDELAKNGKVVGSAKEYEVPAIVLRQGQELGSIRKPFRIGDTTDHTVVGNFHGQPNYAALRELLFQGYGEYGDLYFTFEHEAVLKELGKYVDESVRAYFYELCTNLHEDEFININW